MKDRIDKLLRRKPALKRKEIASELDLPKSEVSAFLHRISDSYSQDGDFRWHLRVQDTIGVTLPGAIWVTADAFEQALVGCPGLLSDAFGSVTFYIPDGCKLRIDCTARLLALLNQLVNEGKSVSIDFTKSEGTKSYLNRAGFFDHLNQSVSVLPSRPAQSAAERLHGQSSTLVEFGSVDPRSNNLKLIKELTAKFVEQSSNECEIAAFTVFSELIGNVAEHSGSTLAGFAGLQRYGGSRDSGNRSRIQTVVSDSGLGIAATLRPALAVHYPELFRKFGEGSLESDIGLVSAAMGGGNISRFGRGRGLGFKSSREQALKFQANFSVRQEQFCIRFEYENGKLVKWAPQTLLARLKGTHICFDFYVA